MPSETPQFFTNRDSKRLFCIYHEPDAAAPRRAFGVVYCAPLFEEKLWSHRIMASFARKLASQGVPTLRFDYFGDGESEGLFDEASVHSRVRDIVDAVTFFRQAAGVEKVRLLGLCYGATLAICAAAASNSVDAAVAWAPVMSGERYLQEVLRAHLSTQLVVHRKVIHDREALVAQIEAGQLVNVEGYEIGRALYTEMRDTDLLAGMRASNKPLLVQQIAPGEATERQYAALESIANPLVEFRKVREVRFWMQQKSIFPPCDSLFRQTSDWLVSLPGS